MPPNKTNKHTDKATPSTTGNRALPLPGVYKNTKFRSQLEIRFVMELEARQLRWYYEPERLGEGRYLVDFYLPDCKSWVEVKGVVDSRDHKVLREVSELLQKERHHRLFMFMDTRAFVVNFDGFKPIAHETFWMGLAKLAILPKTPLDQPTADVKWE